MLHCLRLILLFLLLFAVSIEAQVVSRSDSLRDARKHFSFALQSKKNGDYRDALTQYGKSIALNDTVYQVHFSFAELLMLMNLPDRAKQEYLRTLTLHPGHHASAQVLAGMYYHAAAYDSALMMYETMHRIRPEPDVLSAVATLREYLGRKDAAYEAWKQVVASGDHSHETLVRTAKLGLETGDAVTPGEIAEMMLAQSPNDRDALRIAARVRANRKEFTAAAGYLHRLSEIDSTDTGVLSELETMYRSSGDRKGLILTLERHLCLAPRDSAIIGELAESLFAEGDIRKTELVVRRGIAINPGSGQLHVLLGEVYRTRGDKAQARTAYRAALSDPAWSAVARQFLERLESPRTDGNQREQEFFQRGKR